MKIHKLLKITLVIIAILAFANIKAEAHIHCLNCEDSTAFTTTTTLSLSPSCSAIITFTYIRCEGIYTFYIDNVTTTGWGCYYSIQDLFKLITAKLLITNPLGIWDLMPTPDKGDTCIYPIRIVKPACWKMGGLGTYADSLYVPCDSNACCILDYEVCYDSTGARHFYLNGGMVTAPCEIDTNYYENPCIDVCNDTTEFIGARIKIRNSNRFLLQDKKLERIETIIEMKTEKQYYFKSCNIV